LKLRAFESAVSRALEALGTPCAGDTLVVALSGGADSVALTDALATLSAIKGFRLVAAHLDHGLRPESGDDVAFCASFCAGLGIAFRSGTADVRARARSERCGIEDAARRDRYAFLRLVKEDEGAAVIAVAHNRDDQAETLLLRLLRGAGATGLSAMRPRNRDVIRPLLGLSRRAVRRHLESRSLGWREDSTNADPAFLRNRVRHELLPLLEDRFNPRLRETLARTASLLADEAALVDELAEGLARRTVRMRGGEAVVAYRELAQAPRPLARLALRRAVAAAGGLAGVAAVHVEKLLDLLRSKAPSGRFVPLPGRRQATFAWDELVIGPRPVTGRPFALELAVPGRVDLPDGKMLLAESARGPAVSNEESAVVAAPEDGVPLVVRTRRPGDRVRYRGRDLSLKRFLVTRRVAAQYRTGLPLVAAGSQVLFVPGQPVESPPGRLYVKLSLVEGHPS
jgi:tRNA(Ile)-lysidine synthase